MVVLLALYDLTGWTELGQNPERERWQRNAKDGQPFLVKSSMLPCCEQTLDGRHTHTCATSRVRVTSKSQIPEAAFALAQTQSQARTHTQMYRRPWLPNRRGLEPELRQNCAVVDS